MSDMTPEAQLNGCYRYVKDPARLTRLLRILIWASLGVTVLSLISNIFGFSLLESGNYSFVESDSYGNLQLVVGILYFAVAVPTDIVFLMWVHRANRNCHGFGAEDMEFTPGWAVGYFFVPIVSLWKPFHAVREIWKVSTNPADWRTNPGSWLVGWWWALYLISSFITQIAFRLMLRADSTDSLGAASLVDGIGDLIDIPLLLLAILMVSSIFAKQENLVGRAAGMPVTFQDEFTKP